MNQSQHQQYQQAPQKQGMGAGKIVLIVLGTISVLLFGTCAVCTLAVGGAASEMEKEKKQEEARVQEQLKSCQDTEVVEWASIAAELDENEAKVAASWKGGCKKVSGVVDAVDSDFNDKPIVRIDAGGRPSMNNLRCKPVDDQKALNLTKGQEITVWGIGGDEVLGSLRLDYCDW